MITQKKILELFNKQGASERHLMLECRKANKALVVRVLAELINQIAIRIAHTTGILLSEAVLNEPVLSLLDRL